jgi:hypothetical protein
MHHIGLALTGSKVKARHGDSRNINGRPAAQALCNLPKVGISFADPKGRQPDRYTVEALWNSKLKAAMSQ